MTTAMGEFCPYEPIRSLQESCATNSIPVSQLEKLRYRELWTTGHVCVARKGWSGDLNLKGLARTAEPLTAVLGDQQLRPDDAWYTHTPGLNQPTDGAEEQSPGVC